MNTLKNLTSCRFLIQYHFIFVCKYRRKVLTSLRSEVLSCMKEIARRYNFIIHTQEVDQDHIHLLIESIPRISPSQIARVLKQESTIWLWQRHREYLSRFYWKERTIWSDGYFVSSIGNVSEATIRHYIETQGEGIWQELNLNAIIHADDYQRRHKVRFISATKDGWVFSQRGL